MKNAHGGNLYGKRIQIDFSTNVNPFGPPASVVRAAADALSAIHTYPDPECTKLVQKISEYEKIAEECIIAGNGAAELIDTALRTLKPDTVWLFAPGFSEYERSASALGANIEYIRLELRTDEERSFLGGYYRKNDFRSAEKIHFHLPLLQEKQRQVMILGHPNNPNGALFSEKEMRHILSWCRSHQIWLIADESFLEFSMQSACVGDPMRGHLSFRRYFDSYKNLLILKSFTKAYAIPGLRIGYLLAADRNIKQLAARQVQPWNVSKMAADAAVAALEEEEYLKYSIDYIQKEKERVASFLNTLGVSVFHSDANFLLFHTSIPVYEPLFEAGYLIRDCSNFRGLTEGYFRIAIRKSPENKILMEHLRYLLG